MQYNKCPVCDISMRKGAKCRICGYSESTDYELHKTLAPIENEISTIQKNIEYKKRTSDAIEKRHQEEMDALKKRLAELEEQQKNDEGSSSKVRRQTIDERWKKDVEGQQKEVERKVEKKRKEKEQTKEAPRRKNSSLGLLGGLLGLWIIYMSMVLIVGIFFKENDTEDTGQKELNGDKTTSEIKVGNIITFGHFEQDNNQENGEEAIEWNVLAVEDGKALIQSVYGLWAEAYEEDSEATTWETCTLRTSMNGSFYNNAFDEEEKKQIEKSLVKAESNPTYGTNAGNDTEDYVFLLSINEANKYYVTDEERTCKTTDYAKENGAYVLNDTKYCRWWLRSSGDGGNFAACVSSVGSLFHSGSYVNFDIIVVRPAMWIHL